MPSNTFIDPNGDPLTCAATTIPSWLNFNPFGFKFWGTPKENGEFDVTVECQDDWGASTSVSFRIYTGLVVNTPPVVNEKLDNQDAFEDGLFFYRFPA